MEIKIDEIILMMELLVIRAKRNGFRTIELSEDWYWHVFSYEREVFYTQPNQLGVGSVYDDIEELRKMVSKENDPIPYDFERLAHVLISVSMRINESDKMFL